MPADEIYRRTHRKKYLISLLNVFADDETEEKINNLPFQPQIRRKWGKPHAWSGEEVFFTIREFIQTQWIRTIEIK